MNEIRRFGRIHGTEYRYFVGATAILQQRARLAEPVPYVPVTDMSEPFKVEVENYWQLDVGPDFYTGEKWDQFISDLEAIAPVEFTGGSR